MKRTPFPLIFLLAALAATAQPCSQAMQIRSDLVANLHSRHFDKALECVKALRACDPSFDREADEWTERIFAEIKTQTLQAKAAERRAHEARSEAMQALKKAREAEKQAKTSLAKAERLARFLNFNKENAAWAYNTDSSRFAVIDRDGNRLTDFVYENPEPFHNGVAVAQVENQYVFVNEKGNEMSRRYDYLIPTTENRYIGGTSKERWILDNIGKELSELPTDFEERRDDGFRVIVKDGKKDWQIRWGAL